jgi:hypothetical protein
MIPRRMTVMVLLWALSTACSSTRVLRLDTGQGEPFIHVPRTDDAKPVELGEEESGLGLSGIQTVRVAANREDGNGLRRHGKQQQTRVEGSSYSRSRHHVWLLAVKGREPENPVLHVQSAFLHFW